MTTALDRLRGMAESARRDSLIATAEADILDRLARVAEDEDDERLDGALEELADNLRRALDHCVGVDDDGDDLPSTGCRECAGVERIRVAVEQMAAEQKDASGRATAEFARVSEAVHNAGIEFADFYHEPHLVIDELAAQLNRSEHERDEARAEVELLQRTVREATEPLRRLGIEHCALPSACEMAVAEVERLRAEVASLRWVDDDDDAAPDTDEHDDGWELGPWWSVKSYGLSLKGDGTSYAHVEIPHWMPESNPEPWRASVSPMPGQYQGESAWFASMADGARWCERHPHLSHFFASWQGAQQTEAAYISAPTVGAPDAGPDAPATNVEGDAAKGAPSEGAVPAAPVSPAEQLDEETGVDRPSWRSERVGEMHEMHRLPCEHDHRHIAARVFPLLRLDGTRSGEWEAQVWTTLPRSNPAPNRASKQPSMDAAVRWCELWLKIPRSGYVGDETGAGRPADDLRGPDVEAER